MLRNVPINKLIEVLSMIQRDSSLCDIEIDPEKNTIIFRPVRDTNAITSRTHIETPKLPNQRVDLNDLDDLIV